MYTVSLYQPIAPGSVRLDSGYWIDKQDTPELLHSGNQGVLEKGEKTSAHTTMRLRPGPHTVSIYVPDGKTLYLDYVLLSPSRKERNVIEAESLLDKADTGGAGTIQREDISYDWSGGSALLWKPQPVVGATLQLPITIPADADYSLDLALTPNPNGPLIAAQIDNVDVGILDFVCAKARSRRACPPFFRRARERPESGNA